MERRLLGTGLQGGKAPSCCTAIWDLDPCFLGGEGAKWPFLNIRKAEQKSSGKKRVVSCDQVDKDIALRVSLRPARRQTRCSVQQFTNALVDEEKIPHP